MAWHVGKEHGKETHLVLFFECIVEHPVRDRRVVRESKLEGGIENGGAESVGLSGDGLWWDSVVAGPGACGGEGVDVWMGHGGGEKRKARCAPGEGGRRRRPETAHVTLQNILSLLLATALVLHESRRMPLFNYK